VRVYKATTIVSGNNDILEQRQERILADSWHEAFQILSRAFENPSEVMHECKLVEVQDYPFSFRTKPQRPEGRAE